MKHTARLTVAGLVAALFVVLGGPAPTASACRPIAGNPDGARFCGSIYDGRDKKCKRSASLARPAKCHRRG